MKQIKCQSNNADESLTIPGGYFVHHADFDCDEPYIEASPRDFCVGKEVKIKVPTALAYYLATHFCGSNNMHKLIEDGARREIQNVIKDALGLNDD